MVLDSESDEEKAAGGGWWQPSSGEDRRGGGVGSSDESSEAEDEPARTEWTETEDKKLWMYAALYEDEEASTRWSIVAGLLPRAAPRDRGATRRYPRHRRGLRQR